MEKLSRLEFRTLTVVYKLAKGRTDLPVHKDDILKEIKTYAIYDMTDEEFYKYRAKVLEEVKFSQN
jgi:hypothetical protein